LSILAVSTSPTARETDGSVAGSADFFFRPNRPPNVFCTEDAAEPMFCFVVSTDALVSPIPCATDVAALSTAAAVPSTVSVVVVTASVASMLRAVTDSFVDCTAREASFTAPIDGSSSRNVSGRDTWTHTRSPSRRPGVNEVVRTTRRASMSRDGYAPNYTGRYNLPLAIHDELNEDTAFNLGLTRILRVSETRLQAGYAALWDWLFFYHDKRLLARCRRRSGHERSGRAQGPVARPGVYRNRAGSGEQEDRQTEEGEPGERRSRLGNENRTEHGYGWGWRVEIEAYIINSKIEHTDRRSASGYSAYSPGGSLALGKSSLFKYTKPPSPLSVVHLLPKIDCSLHARPVGSLPRRPLLRTDSSYFPTKRRPAERDFGEVATREASSSQSPAP
jgi:hypothetical protein